MPTVLFPQPAGLGGGSPTVSLPGTGEAIPRGVEAVFQYNGLLFNDRSVIDNYNVESIDGLDDPDVRDAREDNPADDGETPYDSHYGGRTIVFNGQVEAYRLAKLRDMQQALREAFSVLEEEPLHFLTGDPDTDHYINCKKFSKLQWGEEQKHQNHFFRDFQITVRASNPRFLKTRKKTYTLSSTVGDLKGTILGLNPELYWPLDATDGITDQSGNGRNGTGAATGITIGGAAALTEIPGDSSTNFDGSDDRVESSGYNPFQNNVTFTAVVFIERDSTAFANGGIFSSGASNANFGLSDDDALWTVFNTSGSGYGTTFADVVPGVGTPFLAVFTYEESTRTAHLHINDSDAGASSPDITQEYGFTSNVYLGDASASWTGNPGNFDGKMSHFAIFEYELSDSEIEDIYNTSQQGYLLENNAQLANMGNYSAEPIIKIIGPMSNVEFDLQDEDGNVSTFALLDSVSIADDDFYLINVANKTVLDKNGVNKFGDVDPDSVLPKLYPGTNLLVIPEGKCTTTSADATIQITFRDSYI